MKVNSKNVRLDFFCVVLVKMREKMLALGMQWKFESLKMIEHAFGT